MRGLLWGDEISSLCREKRKSSREIRRVVHIHGTSFREFNIASHCKWQPCVFLYKTLCNEVPYTGEDPSPIEIQWLSCITDKNS